MTNRSEQINDIAMALSKAQGMMKPVIHNAKVDYKTKSGQRVNYTYATLGAIWDCIREPLSTNELAVIQTIQYDDNGAKLVATLIHSSGQWYSSEMRLPNTPDMKAFAEAETYARRYTISPLVGIVADEDRDAPEPIEQPNQNGQQPATKDGKPILTAEQTRDLYIKRLRALEKELNAFEKEAGNTETKLLGHWLRSAPFDNLEAKGKDMQSSLEQWRFLEEQKKAEIETEDEIPF